MNVWRLITHHADPSGERDWPNDALTWMLANHRIAIGWAGTGDVSKFPTERAVIERSKQVHRGMPNGPFSGKQIWNFCYGIKEGDFVILATDKGRQAVMRVTGPYEFTGPMPVGCGDYRSLRAADPMPLDANELWRIAGASAAPGFSIRWALVRCPLAVSADGRQTA